MSVKNVKEFLCSVKCVMLTNTDQSSSRNFISNNYNCKHRFINKLIKKKQKPVRAAFYTYISLPLACVFFSHMTLFTFCSVVYTPSSPYKRSGKIVLSLGAAIPDFLTSWNCPQPSRCNTLKPKNAKDIKAAEQRHRPRVQMKRLS